MEYHFKAKDNVKVKGLLDIIENPNVISNLDNKLEENSFSGYIEDLPKEVFYNIALELLNNNEN